MIRDRFEPSQAVSQVAQRHGINSNQLCRQQFHQDDSLSAVSAGEAVVPASELPDATKQIRELQRLLGKKTMEAELLNEAVEVARSRNWIARSSLVIGGRSVKRGSNGLTEGRSQLLVCGQHPEGWQDERRQKQSDDTNVVANLKRLVADLPSYGYRRAWWLFRR